MRFLITILLAVIAILCQSCQSNYTKAETANFILHCDATGHRDVGCPHHETIGQMSDEELKEYHAGLDYDRDAWCEEVYHVHWTCPHFEDPEVPEAVTDVLESRQLAECEAANWKGHDCPWYEQIQQTWWWKKPANVLWPIFNLLTFALLIALVRYVYKETTGRR